MRTANQDRRPAPRLEAAAAVFYPHMEERHPARRVAYVSKDGQEVPVYPSFMFRPRARIAYEVMVRFFRRGKGWIGIAQPAESQALTREELLEEVPLRKLSFKTGKRGGLVAYDEDTGIVILPSSKWAEIMGTPPAADQEYDVQLVTFGTTLLIALPIAERGEEKVDEVVKALVAWNAAKNLTAYHLTHVTSGGDSYMHFRDYLRLGERFTVSEVEEKYKKGRTDSHPDRDLSRYSPAMQEQLRKSAGTRFAAYRLARLQALAALNNDDGLRGLAKHFKVLHEDPANNQLVEDLEMVRRILAGDTIDESEEAVAAEVAGAES